jgi:TonB family protein
MMRREKWQKCVLLRAAAIALVCVFGLPLHGRAEDRAIKTRVAPVYPEIAKRMKVSGLVKLDVTVDAEGKVTDVKEVSGNHTLSIAAEEAVRKWKFAPGSGTSTVPVELNFELTQ